MHLHCYALHLEWSKSCISFGFLASHSRLEVEQAACDTVQKDTQGLRKIIDDTNFLRLKLEGDLESLGEELAYLRKSHEEVRPIFALPV